MTVPIEASRTIYAGNGVATAFSTGWYFLVDSEVVVKLKLSGGIDVIQTLGVHYTVNPAPEVGSDGTVTMLAAPPAGSTLTIERTVPFTQATSFRTQGTFSRAVHEDAMDEIVFQNQQLDRRLKSVESAGAPGSVVAGNGLSFAATTLNVGAGAGIQSNADTVEVLYGTNPRAVNADVFDNGAVSLAARADHKHSADVGPGAALAVGQAAGVGVSVLLSRADHAHGVPVGAPVAITKAAAVTGASGNFSDADHKHDVSTAVAVTLTDASNAEGAATSLARSDHTHAHGARGGDTLHAVATTALAGFLAAADKVKINTLGALLASLTHIRVTRATAVQTITSGVATTILFNTVEYDADAEFSTITGKYTAKNAGYLHVCGRVSMKSVALLTSTTCLLIVSVNGVTTKFSAGEVIEVAATRTVNLVFATVIKVAATDTVEVILQHNLGSNWDVDQLNGNTQLCIDRLL